MSTQGYSSGKSIEQIYTRPLANIKSLLGESKILQSVRFVNHLLYKSFVILYAFEPGLIISIAQLAAVGIISVLKGFNSILVLNLSIGNCQISA